MAKQGKGSPLARKRPVVKLGHDGETKPRFPGFLLVAGMLLVALVSVVVVNRACANLESEQSERRAVSTIRSFYFEDEEEAREATRKAKEGLRRMGVIQDTGSPIIF